MSGVTFKDVAKRYETTSVIEGLNLDIQDHEFMVLVGPSGCGKSTALRMIAGLEEISAGEISIKGRVVNTLPPKDRDVAMVFQSYALYPHMTVRENLEFGLKIRKTPKAEMDRLINEAAATLAIEPLLARKPKQLSGGQRQRVALGRALVRQPAVFLFDEPLSNLDAKLRVQMRAEIKKLQARTRTTSVYVTHDQVEAMTMGNRIAVMNAGRLQQVGTPLEVYDHPANVFVANFIGSPPMSFFSAKVSGGHLAAKAFALPIPAAHRAALSGQEGKGVMVGVRPEHLGGAGTAARGEVAPIPAQVEFVEPLGDQVIVHARGGEDRFTYKVEPQASPTVGDTVTLQAQLDRLHLFDAATEQRL